MGVTLIPEMAVPVETRSASVSVARFKDPQPTRTIGMIWRRTSPLGRQLLQISEVVSHSADALRKQHDQGPSSRDPRAKRYSGGRRSPKSRTSTEAEARKTSRR
jgi:LysR family hydrogen peroxide-inducible transcriptional activator